MSRSRAATPTGHDQPGSVPDEPVPHTARVVAAPVRAPRRAARSTAGRGGAFTIEQAAAIEPAREYRLSPDGRSVACTMEMAGARQIVLLSLSGGPVRQVTASEKNVSDPRWSPDGRRLAFVREDEVWVIDLRSARQTRVTDHPAGSRSPRWSPDGRQLAFLSRRRGWDQVWLVEAPTRPQRGRASARPGEARAVTTAGIDVDEFCWSPDGARIAVMAQRSPDLLTSQVTVVDVVTGEERQIAGEHAWEYGARWLPDGSGLLLGTDESGWYQVLRVDADGGHRIALTTGEREHGEVSGRFGPAALPSPAGDRFVHLEVRDGYVDLVVAPIAEGFGRGVRISPSDGVWQPVGWLPDGSAVLAVGESERSPADLWLLPAPPAAALHGFGDGPGPASATASAPVRRARRLTSSLPAAVAPDRFATGERVELTARDGLVIPATLWRPAGATGADGAPRVPVVVHSHGGPTWQAYREWNPMRELVVGAGMAFLSVDFRGSTGYGRDFRWANREEWGHADAHDVIDAARWARSQAWCDGRLAHFGGSYGGYMTLCVLTDEPELWSCGIDLFGDSEIAESFRHGDRPGRIDLERMMGHPDDPARAELFRRGSPLYRAERIQAPLLILHGRKDKRVVPLMTEKMVEALEIEGKHHLVHWYDDEGHGWQRRESRRDAWRRCLDFLRQHLLDEPPPERE